MPQPIRIACLFVPLFPLAARLRAEPELRGQAVVIVSGSGPRATVVAATRAARQAGVSAGQTLTQARARVADVIARGRDAACERAAQEALLDVAQTLAPRVEDAGEGLVYLDITGLDRHHPGPDWEQDLGRILQHDVEHQAGLPVWIGIAGSTVVAGLAARRGAGPTIVSRGEEASFLAPLPLDHLDPTRDTRDVLRGWGVRTLGDLARLGVDEVRDRLGAEGQRLHRLARGHADAPLMPRIVPPTFTEGLELEWALVEREPLLYAVRAALERLIIRLASQGLACRQLDLTLRIDAQPTDTRSYTLPRPTRALGRMLELIDLDLERRPAAGPIAGFTLTAHPDTPRRTQLSLFGPEAPSPDALANALGHLFQLLGERRVGTPLPRRDAHPGTPDTAPYDPPDPPAFTPPSRPGRGLLTVRNIDPPRKLVVVLRDDPAPAAAVHEAPAPAYDAPVDETPAAFIDAPDAAADAVEDAAGGEGSGPPSWIATIDGDGGDPLHIEGGVRVATGPYPMQDDWRALPDRRVYWDVELTDGGLYRIYEDLDSGSWFLDGIYD
ncbi:MAG: DNA polymerase Y family protein [Acidobacteriota bacterium]